MADSTDLPSGLPAPVDDGAADHLKGMVLPDVELDVAGGGRLPLTGDSSLWSVVYVYPRTGGPAVELPDE